jgi:hypothetical protein
MRKLATAASGPAVALLSLTVAVFLVGQVLNALSTRRQLRATLQETRQRHDALRRQNPRDPRDYQLGSQVFHYNILPLVRDLVILARTDPQAADVVQRHPVREYLEIMEPFDRLFPGESPEDVHLREPDPFWDTHFPTQ